MNDAVGTFSGSNFQQNMKGGLEWLQDVLLVLTTYIFIFQSIEEILSQEIRYI